MPRVNSSLITILLKNAIFDIVANFEPVFSGQGIEMVKKPEDMLKTMVIAS